jgi:hypothetical protein
LYLTKPLVNAGGFFVIVRLGVEDDLSNGATQRTHVVPLRWIVVRAYEVPWHVSATVGIRCKRKTECMTEGFDDPRRAAIEIVKDTLAIECLMIDNLQDGVEVDGSLLLRKRRLEAFQMKVVLTRGIDITA